MIGGIQHHQIDQPVHPHPGCVVARAGHNGAPVENGNPRALSLDSSSSQSIELWPGYSILVDSADAEAVASRSWRLNQGILRERRRDGSSLGYILLQPGPRIQVMHANGDRRDFRRINLTTRRVRRTGAYSAFLGSDGLWRVPVANSEPAIVDPQDAEWLSQYRWYGAGRAKEYARCACLVQGRRASIAMHRTILGAPDGVLVDHINRNTRDNRRENLRLADASQNSTNSVSGIVPKSGFRGVIIRRGRFRAIIQARGKTYYGGVHSTAAEAARAYDDLARRLHGEFAVLNFPEAGR